MTSDGNLDDSHSIWVHQATPHMIDNLRSWDPIRLPSPFDVDTRTMILIRTGSPWDYLVALGLVEVDSCLARLALVLKNAVPLWQLASALPNGALETARWNRIARLIIIHNPGLSGAIRQLEREIRDDRAASGRLEG